MHIIFFNHYHNGDIHASRGIIKQIINTVTKKNINTSFSYSHRNPSNLLIDIDNLNYDPQAINNVKDYDNLLNINNIIYINTWYGQKKHFYLNKYGITFDSLYAALNDTCKELWKFSLEEISFNINDFFPIIDYSKFSIDNIKSWLNKNTNKKILIENGLAKSHQAINFAITPIIIKIAQKHLDKIFILSNKENINLPKNVVFATDIIQIKDGSDLNEMSFLSTHCDLIIGRASGVFTFSLTQENLFKRNIKYLCFSNLIPTVSNKFWIGNLLKDKVFYSSNIFTTNESNSDAVFNIINGVL